MKNKGSKKPAATNVNAVFSAAEGESGSPVELKQKHHKKPKKVYE